MSQRWEKVLYKKQDIPDNFVSEHFLSELQKNLYIRQYDLYSLIVQAGSIYQQLCCIAIFISIYFYLLSEWITPTSILIGLFLSLTIGCALFYVHSWLYQRPFALVSESRTGVVILVFSFILSPILHSLLATVSTDSIYALAVIFLTINWAFMDYTTPSAEFTYEPGSNTTALSSSLLAALCLASRLPTAYHTFVLIIIWASIFALWPSIAYLVRAKSNQRGRLGLTIAIGVVTNLLVWPITYHEAPVEYVWLTGVAMLVFTASLNFFMPWLLIKMQRIRRNIHGPWDEAVLKM